MPMKKKKALAWALLILWCVVIFAFSEQDSEESSRMSAVIVEPVMRLADCIHPMDVQTRLAAEEGVTIVVRKMAHMSEYAILALLAVRLACLYGLARPALWVLAFAVLYAAGDEWHQYLGGSRTGQWMDVLIDGAGAGVGLLARAGFSKVKRKQ